MATRLNGSPSTSSSTDSSGSPPCTTPSSRRNVPAPNRANRYLYFIQVQRFMEMAYDDAFQYDWTRGGLNLLANTRRAIREPHVSPLGYRPRAAGSFPNWVQGYEAHWRNKACGCAGSPAMNAAETAARYADDAKAFGEHLKEITEQYQVAYIELDRELAIDKVCDIFTQVNSKGIRLDVFDLINALLKPKGCSSSTCGATPLLSSTSSIPSG